MALREHDDTQRLLAAVRRAVDDDEPVCINGRGSKAFLGVAVGNLLSLSEHSGGIDYRPDELVLTARAGTPLSEIRRVLSQRGQCLAFDPPQFAGDGSLGGAVAAGLSGPARPWGGSIRDAVLGVTLINGYAQRLTFGGQVMKNVAGYDVSRLMVGAFGTLGVLLEVSVKVMPLPQVESTRVFEMSRDAALANVIAWARTPLPLSATCHVDGVLYVRVSGTESGVRAAVAQIGGAALPHPDEFWNELRDQSHRFFTAAQPWRFALPAAAPYPDIAGDWLTEWAGSQRWLRTDARPEAVVAAARGACGYATPFFELRPIPALDSVALKYHRRLKAAFDPKAIFNRDRLWAER